MKAIPGGLSAEAAHYRDVLRERGLSQKWLAQTIHFSQPSVSLFLRGKTRGQKSFSRNHLPIGDMIAAALGVDPETVNALRELDRREEATRAAVAAAQRLRALKAQAGSDGAQSPVDLRHSGVAATSWSDPRFSPAA